MLSRVGAGFIQERGVAMARNAGRGGGRWVVGWLLVGALALSLAACSGGGGDGGGGGRGSAILDAVPNTVSNTVPNTVVVSGTLGAIRTSALATHTVDADIAVVAIDESGAVVSSETTRDRFSLRLPTGHDYVIAFRDRTVTGTTLGVLAFDDGDRQRALFSLAPRTPDVDLGTLTLQRGPGSATSDRRLAGRLAPPARTPLDTDGDLIPDTMDRDDDNDRVADANDAFPLDPTESLDTDGDGVGNHADADDDGDGVADLTDCAPLDPSRQRLASDGSTCVAAAQTASVAGMLFISPAGSPGEAAVSEAAVSEVEPNDTGLTAQLLDPHTPAPSYLLTGTLSAGDPQDTFYLTESVARRVTLTLTHDATADFDLQVYDVAGDGTLTALGASTRTTSPEAVVYDTPAAPQGEKFMTVIVVIPVRGSGAYQLQVRAEASPTAAGEATFAGRRRVVSVAGHDRPPRPVAQVWDLSAVDAVAGEVLVKLRPQAAAVHSSSTASWDGLTPCGRVTGVATLLCDAGAPAVRASSVAPSDPPAERRRTVARVLRLRADPRVAEAIPNARLHPATLPNDALYPHQWNYPMIGLPEAWETTTGSAEVIVAVLDTGITDHPDLAGRVIDGYDFVSHIASAGDGDGLDPDPTDPGDVNPFATEQWHGTHVAGIIGAATDNGIGVAGVDWHCQIMPVRVLGRGSNGTTADLLNGILYAAGLPNDSGTVPPRRADIINMSLSGHDPGGQTAHFAQPVIDQARRAGVLLVAAAGNEATSIPSFPAGAAGVLSVSAVDATGERASYANFGPTIDLAAPGGSRAAVDMNGDGDPDGILSTRVDSTTGAYNYDRDVGTSMAAPQVAGVAALCLAANPDLTVDQLETVLFATATDLGLPGRDDRYGFGLVNAAAAVEAAASGAPATTLEVSPSLLSFGASETRQEVALRSTGASALAVSNPVVTTTDGHPWLAATLDSATRTAVVVRVDRTGMAAGRYTGRVTLESTGGSQTVEVSMEVAATPMVTNPPVVTDIGTVFVRLVDPADGSVVQETQTSRTSGYRYTFVGVAAGRYTLRAATDRDGDGVLCEADDYCGAYPVLSQPVPIEVPAGAQVTGRDFALTDQGGPL